jgi:hypothetical protein
VEAGVTQIRPVLMTATAMIVGMLSVAIGEPGGEQNAALTRAVVGGLLFATPGPSRSTRSPSYGKTVRRSHDRAKGRVSLHLVSAFAANSRLVLGA